MERQRAVQAPAPRAASPAAKKAGGRKTKSKKATSHGAPLPDFIPPSLATVRATAPSGPGWVHEIKFDGYRIQARLDHGEVRSLTRKGLDWTDKFPNIAEAVAKLPADTALIDGEIVVEDERGISNFSMLQAALKAGERERFVYYVFDLLHCDGRDLTELPLIERKAELKRLLGKSSGPIRISEHFDDEGSLVLAQACRMTLEGIVSKRADAHYRSGRSETFIKTKCSNAQEFVVGGYSPSTALPKAIGVLAVGYCGGGQLVYAGRIGTGYTHATARDVYKRLHPLEIEKAPFDRIPAAEGRRRDVRWVEPRMVIEANLRGWTADGLVRQAAFRGVREDKPTREVVREFPAAVERPNTPRRPRRLQRRHRRWWRRHRSMLQSRRGPAPQRASVAPRRRRAPSRGARETSVSPIRTASTGSTSASPSRTSLTTTGRSGTGWRRTWSAGRLRWCAAPEGTKGPCFFQKHASAGLTEQSLRIVTDSKKRQVIAVEALDGLLSLVQAGVLEVHVRGSLINSLERCDRIVFELDPGEGVGWSDIVGAAKNVRERLASLDLESFVKLSGGKGLHVMVPVAGTDWDETKTFVQAFAQRMAADDPERYVATMAKSQRPGKIFVDYLRNSLEQTSVAAYSTRAREGAPVSTPVTWQELGRTTGSNQYTVLNLMKRLAGLKQDPWKDIGRVKQKLPSLQALRGQ